MTKKNELERFDAEEPKPEKPKSNIRAAVAAHLAGIDYQTIAERYQYYDAKTAQIAVERLIGQTWGDADLKTARAKSVARKEKLLQSVWYDATHAFVIDSDGKQTDSRNEAHIPMLDRAIRILESIDRLLGLNAPTQVEVYRPGADEFLATVTELKAAVMAGQPQEADIFDAEIVDDEEDVS